MITTKSNTRQDIGGKSLRVVFGYCLKTKEKKDEDYGGKERWDQDKLCLIMV